MYAVIAVGRNFERSNPKPKEEEKMCQEVKWTLLKGNRTHQNLGFLGARCAMCNVQMPNVCPHYDQRA